MKKIILVTIALIICLFAAACGNTSEDAQASASKTEESNNIPTNEVALVYTDPEIDLSIMVYESDWIYTKELYPGEVFFYPKDKDPTKTKTGFAISSQVKGDGTDVEKTWDIAKNSLEKEIRGLTTKHEEEVKAGEYIAKRYHFSGFAKDGKEMIGDYFLWMTDSRLYICSFTSEEDYDKNLEIVINSLNSFKTVSKK